MRFWLGIAAALAMLVPCTSRADERPASAETRAVTDVDGLLAECAKMPGLAARFTEEKKIALLAVPLRSSGSVHFMRSRGLVRHTTEPSKQSVLVSDKEIVFWDGKSTKRISLASSETVEAFARVFSLILAADRAGLERHFSLDFRPREQGVWSLKLVPKGAALKGVIAAIEVDGRGSVLSTLTVREVNGDVSTTRFSDVDTAKRYSDDEARRVFQVPPP